MLASSTFVFASDPCQSDSSPYGPMTCSVGTTDSVHANGPLNMTDTIVKQATSVNGPFVADKAHLAKLTVNGPVIISSSVVSGTSDINGPITATKSSFDDTLTVAANAVVLTDSNLSDIIVKGGDDGVVSPQTITIKGDSVIDGDITFNEKDGLVYVGPNVKITGKVIGGKVEKTAVSKVQVKDTSVSKP
jgi:hypothetical protein